MARYIALLRAINVGGRVVTMDRLRRAFVAGGCREVETFLASGNVVFESRARAATLEHTIENRLTDALGYQVVAFVRTDVELAAVANHVAFPAQAVARAAALNVGFVREPMGLAAAAALTRLETPLDRFHVQGREVYWLCRVRQNESTFSNAVFERALGIRATFRGISTVTRLSAKYPPATRCP
jgi:uncharacterized protein (DUF1697 family)